MDKHYKKLRSRYDHVMCGVDDHDLFNDVQWLLGYAESLRERLALCLAVAEITMEERPFEGRRVH